MEGEPGPGDILQRITTFGEEPLKRAVGRLSAEQGEGLREIATISDDIKELELAMAERARGLNDSGVPWFVIGAALGLTAQGVHYRYGRRP